MAEAPPKGLPLSGMVVLDLSRMLPGAVLARQLLDLGARLIKVEEPGTGDPMRLVPPLVGGVGVGYAALLRGAESAALDLRDPRDLSRVRALAGRADVLVESFRPGTMERWGLGWDELSSANPRLVWCSLSSYGRTPAVAARIGHDLNFIAESGALRELCEAGVPGLQLADVAGALLAASAVLAALLERERRGIGRFIDQLLARQRAELEHLVASAGFVCIAGGHVAVLLNRLRLFGLRHVLRSKPLAAWSAGAMAIAARVVLFHDHPPQGAGNAGLFEAGLGLLRGTVFLPHAASRLALDDRDRVMLLARRLAPASAFTLGRRPAAVASRAPRDG